MQAPACWYLPRMKSKSNAFHSHSFWWQITFLVLCAATNAVVFCRWLRLPQDLKLQVWGLLSWFSAIVFLGSIIGVVVWTLFMQNNELVQKFGKPGYQVTNGLFYSTYSSYHYGMAVRFIFVGFELLCVCLAMLMTLDRIMEHVVRGMQAEIEAARQDNFWYGASSCISGRCDSRCTGTAGETPKGFHIAL
jgi:hypothetical protein